MHSIPIVVLPGLDAPDLPLNFTTGVGTFFRPVRMFIWKPPGSAYAGAPGNLQLRLSTGTLIFNSANSSVLTNTDAGVISFIDQGVYPLTGLDKYDLFFATADITGDGPPLYYTIFYTRVPLTCPLQLS